MLTPTLLKFKCFTMKNYIILFISIAFMFSCNISDLEENSIEKTVSTAITDEALSKFIIASGFDSTKVTDHGDFYLIEECIIIDKTALNEGDYDVLKQYPENAHARTTNLVGGNSGTNKTIRVKIDSSIPTSGIHNWRTEIQQALQDYNSIRNFRLKFQLVTTGSYDILIRGSVPTDYLPYNTVAIASWPSNQNPGSVIIINFNYNNQPVPSGVKRYNIVHEIGHTIGFRHTNWSLLGELVNYPGDPAGPGATNIHGTWDQVNGSVMNGLTATHSWNGFHYLDILAFRTLYPFDAGERPIYTYFNSSGTSHNWTSNWSEFGSSGNGYLYRGYTAFLFNYQKAGTVPLYRFRNNVWNLYYLTTNINLFNNDPAWTLNSTIGYVYNSPNTNNIPVYEYYHPNEGHFYTTNYNDNWVNGSGWIGGSIAFYAEKVN